MITLSLSLRCRSPNLLWLLIHLLLLLLLLHDFSYHCASCTAIPPPSFGTFRGHRRNSYCSRETDPTAITTTLTTSSNSCSSSTITKLKTKTKTPSSSSLNVNNLSPSAQILLNYLERLENNVPESSPDGGGGGGGTTKTAKTTRSPPLQNFYFHGWRWHTMAIIRESKRLSHVIAMLGPEQLDPQGLHKAASFIINFNMKGLHKVENEIFFPWLRNHISVALLQESSSTQNEKMNKKGHHHHHHQQQQQQQSKHEKMKIISAMDSVLKELELKQRKIKQCGNELMLSMTALSSPKKKRQQLSSSLLLYNNNKNNNKNNSYEEEKLLWSTVAMKSIQISQQTQEMMIVHNSIIIPFVSKFITSKNQKDLNYHVLKRLGIWNSRLHLVSMHQVIFHHHHHHQESLLLSSSSSLLYTIPTWNQEKNLFIKTIPILAQRMIPRWKKLLYDPEMAILD